MILRHQGMNLWSLRREEPKVAVTGQGCLNKSQAFSRTSRVHPPVPGVSQGPLWLLCLHCNPPSSPTPTPALLCSPPVVLDQQHPITWVQRREPRSQAPPSYTRRMCILTRSPEGGGASLVPKMVKNLPSVWETQVQSLGQEDPLEKGMATPEFHAERRLAASMGWQRVWHDWDSLPLSGGGGDKSPRVHCALCCAPLPCRVCERRVIVSSMVRSGFPSGSCVPAKSLQSCPALASGFFNPYRHPVVNISPAMQELQEMRVWSLGRGKFPGGGNGNGLQSSCLGNSIDRGACWATVREQLSTRA